MFMAWLQHTIPQRGISQIKILYICQYTHMHTHTHTHTYTNTHACTHTHTHTCTHTHVHKHTACTHTHTHTHTHAHTHTHTRTQTHTHAHRFHGVCLHSHQLIHLSHLRGGPPTRSIQHPRLHRHMLSHWFPHCHGVQGP